MRTDYKSDRAENTIWGQRVPRNFPKGGYKLYLPFLTNSQFVLCIELQYDIVCGTAAEGFAVCECEVQASVFEYGYAFHDDEGLFAFVLHAQGIALGESTSHTSVLFFCLPLCGIGVGEAYYVHLATREVHRCHLPQFVIDKHEALRPFHEVHPPCPTADGVEAHYLVLTQCPDYRSAVVAHTGSEEFRR